MTRWGKAGVRLTEQEAASRDRLAAARRGRSRATRDADDRIAYRLWLAGELKPYLITDALNLHALEGPEVDKACGASEPDVDLWEAGKLYPTWRQVLLLADLVGVTPRFLCQPRETVRVRDTSLRFHGFSDDGPPMVWAFDAAAVQATVVGAPPEMPSEEVPDAR